MDLIPSPPKPSPGALCPFLLSPMGLWLYGNYRLLGGPMAFVEEALTNPVIAGRRDLDRIGRKAEEFVLYGKVLVTGIHNAFHQAAAIVPLRWGAPRILILSGGFHFHLGADLTDEPFRAARLWRYRFDPQTDLAVSRRAPWKLPTYALENKTVDRLVVRIATLTGSLKQLATPFSETSDWPPPTYTCYERVLQAYRTRR